MADPRAPRRQACAAADELKSNLDGEFVAVRDFIAAFCRCMDYVQHARMLVVGYPWTPDVLAITNLVRPRAPQPPLPSVWHGARV